MTPVDLVGDTGGFLLALEDSIDALSSQVAGVVDALTVLAWAVGLVLAVTIARFVSKR